MYVFDHNTEWWREKFVRHGRNNGAATYSAEIVEHQLPIWESFFPDAVVSTCPSLHGQDVRGGLVVQYLHEYPRQNATGWITGKNDYLRARFDRVVFVTAYRSFHTRMAALGIESMFVPMTIDTEKVRAHVTADHYTGKNAVYFGNVQSPKAGQFQEISRAFKRAGWRLDVISYNQYNRFKSQTLDQAQSWDVLAQYRYGVGVGRCLLEMQALGLRTLVSGERFGGLVTTAAEYEVQHATNYNGRVTTFDDDPDSCIESFNAALVMPYAADVTIAQRTLLDQLGG